MNKAREIAERLGFEQYESANGDIRYRVPFNDNDSEFEWFFKSIGFNFNPYENWNDCGMVLEAVVNKEKGDGVLLFNTQLRSSRIKGMNYMVGMPFNTKGEDLKTAICEAFLSLDKVD